MTGAVYMDFEDPDSGAKRSVPLGGDKKPPKEPSKALVPKPPEPEMPLTGDELRAGVSDRARAVAKYRTLGYSYQEIADIMGLKDAKEAQRIHHSVIAATLDPDSIETQRAVVLSRAEMLFKSSLQMATATYLVAHDEEGEPIEVENTERLRWHQVAANDLMNIAVLTGAKAPTKIEFTPGEADLERLVEEFVRRAGHEDIMDAEVIELDQIPDRGDPDDPDERF